MKLAIFVEGGGKGRNSTVHECRIGFARLFEKLLPMGAPRPQVIPCGTRSEAYRSFTRALAQGTHADAILLVDSEGPVAAGLAKWLYVRNRPNDKWERPAKADELHLHFMAECMEAWIVADTAALARFYGKDFNGKALPSTDDLETVSKKDLERALKTATERTRGGAYHKTGHAFKLLAEIDPARIERRCPGHAAALFGLLRSKLGSEG